MGDLAQIIEGMRLTGRERTGTGSVVYGQANIGAMRWRLLPFHFRNRPMQDRGSVQPGDIAINKILPVRAAWATSRLYRHPVDGNCIVVRGLDVPTGFWVALCLNQPLYRQYLSAQSEGSLLPRIKMRTLRDLPVLTAPEESPGLAARAWAVTDDLLAQEETVWRMVGEAEARICPPETLRFWEERIASLEKPSWWKRVSSALIPESLLPGHALFEILRHELQTNLGWVPLSRCLALAPERDRARRQRFSASDGEPVKLRCLRISDVGSDFTVSNAPTREEVGWPGRVYLQPLQQEEVLVSLLVTSPTVAYAGDFPRPDIHVTDHWERLFFRETPGAWALVLNSPLVRMQLRLLAQGSARQFLGSGSLGQVLVPKIAHEERLHWDRALLRYQRHRLELEEAWRKLWHEAVAVYDRTHREAGVAISFSAEGQDGGVGV